MWFGILDCFEKLDHDWTIFEEVMSMIVGSNPLCNEGVPQGDDADDHGDEPAHEVVDGAGDDENEGDEYVEPPEPTDHASFNLLSSESSYTMISILVKE